MKIISNFYKLIIILIILICILITHFNFSLKTKEEFESLKNHDQSPNEIIKSNEIKVRT